jgi:tetratricopeptide (TPR) repeat protein
MSTSESDKSLYSPSIFIGREKEIKDFWDTLENSKQRILHIQAAGGMGKTKLLTEFINQLEGLPRDKTAIYPNEPIDLYHTTYQIELGILTSIASQFPSSFKSFREHISKYRREPSSTAQEELRDEFIKCYRELKANYIVLFFDTVEEINEPIKNFFHAVFPRLLEAQPSTLIVTAGRKPFPIEQLFSSLKTIELTGFIQSDIFDYFQHTEIRSLIKTDFCDNEDLLEKLAELSQGKPILIGLTVDWMRNGNFLDTLLDMPPEEFERNLVKQIELLSRPENQVILAMAHFYKRFDERILVALFPELAPTETDAIQFIKKMNRYSFIKYRELNKIKHPLGGMYSCLLHDEMRELIRKHIWSYLDGSKIFLKGWTEVLLQYYDKLINEMTIELDKSQSDELRDELVLELRSLQREKLYYFCFFDFNNAFKYYDTLRVQTHYNSWDIHQVFLEILEPHEKEMNDAQRVNYLCNKAHVYYESHDYEQYIQIARSVLDIPYPQEPASLDTLRGELICGCIQAFTNTGKIVEAIEFGDKYRTFFTHDSKNLSQSGNFFNAMGYAFRRQGIPDKAIKYYEAALNTHHKTEAPMDSIASTEINFAFTLHLLGMDQKAKNYCKSALKKSNDRNIQWRANNVLGIIESDSQRFSKAAEYFQIALGHATDLKNERGRAMIRSAQGRMYRQSGESTHLDEASVTKDYQTSEICLNEAIFLFEKNTGTNSSAALAEAYNEKGILLRDTKKFREALSCFEKSKSLAQQNHNVYMVADNLQRIASIYYRIGPMDKAESYARDSIQLAYPKGVHVIARAERILANVAYARGDCDSAMKTAFSAIIHVLGVDPNSQDDSPHKKEVLFDFYCSWLVDLLEGLSDSSRTRYKSFLLESWSNSLIVDKDHYGFDILLDKL